MSRIPNAVAFVFFIGLVVTLSSVLTAPAGTHLALLAGGVVATLMLSLIVAGGVWLRTRLRRDRSST